MKKRLLAASLGLLVLLGTATNLRAADDLLPWPWGSECPFPWSNIEGDWIVREGMVGQRFVFRVKGRLNNGSRVLEVHRYDQYGRLIAEGEGVAPANERIVRAAMVGLGPDQGNSYWALVRTYNSEPDEGRKRSCTRAKLVTVITLRPLGIEAENSDYHLVVDKVDL